MSDLKIRLALRAEGAFWNAYVARMEDMRDAKLIGSIALAIVEDDPAAKDAFQALMADGFAKMLRAIVKRPVAMNDPVPAPDHERGGSA